MVFKKNPKTKRIFSSLYSLGAGTRCPLWIHSLQGPNLADFFWTPRLITHMQVKKGHIILPSVQKRFFMLAGNKSNTRNCIYLSLEVTMFSHQLIMKHPLGILTVLNPVQDFRHTIKSAVEPACIQSKVPGYHSNYGN